MNRAVTIRISAGLFPAWLACAIFIALPARAQQDQPVVAQQEQQQYTRQTEPDSQQNSVQSAPEDAQQGAEQKVTGLQDLLDQNQPPSIQILDAATSATSNSPQLGEQPGMGVASSNIPLPYELSRGTGFLLSAQTQAGYDSNFLLLPVQAQGNNFDGMQFLLHYDMASDRLGFQLNYTPSFTIYPGYSALTNTSQGVSQTLSYRWSNRTVFYWAASGARIPSYSAIVFPQALNVGGISVIISNLINSIANNTSIIYSADTTLGGAHALSERDVITFNGIASSLELKQKEHTPGTIPFGLRDQTLSSDIHYQHILDTQRSVGLEFTELYIRGLQPRGQQTSEVLMLTYQTPILNKTIATLGAGPLYTHASTHPSVVLKGLSYAVNAGLTRQVENAQFNVQYTRGYQLGFVGGAYISHSIGGGVTVPLTRRLIASAGMGFVFSSVPNSSPGTAAGSFNELGYTGRMDYRLNTHNALYFLFARSQFDSSNQSYYTFSRNQYSAGYTYIFSRTNREGQ